MKQIALAMVGFGNVGQAFARLLQQKEQELAEKFDINIIVTGIITGRHGGAINSGGINLSRALETISRGQSLDILSEQPVPGTVEEFIFSSSADAMLETSPVNHHTGQPAIDHCKAALNKGMHAITANKGPVVHAYRSLTDLAATKGVKFFHEAAVMDGAPIFSLFRSALPGARLLALRGVLNSTTNLILTRMEQGESFAEALAYAQSIGIAETDPSGDIDGWDAAVKVAALVTVLMDTPFKPAQVERTGIRGINPQLIEQAKAQGKRWKLVCSARRTEEGIQARVAPEMVGRESPMYSVDGTTSIVQFETDVLGLLSLVENNPGTDTTAYGLLADFLNAVA